jgi:hypothetical protein
MLSLAIIGGSNMRGIILSAALGATALTGCYTTGEVGVSATYATPNANADVYATTPDLVSVGPGVQVVADYDEPVFYTDGFYWRYNNGYWYRSSNYASGWFYVSAPPVVIARIDRPYAYAHYRPSGYVSRRNVRYAPPQPIVRDHRTVAPAARPPAYAPQGAVVRDHRTPAPAPAPARAPAPVVRDHRAPAPAPSKDVRDHRHD